MSLGNVFRFHSIISSYSLLRAGHPSNRKRGGACLYFKEHLQLIRRNDRSILQEYLVTKIIVDNGKCFFTCLYESPNQNHEELENFSSNLDLLLSNINDNHPTCSILIGDLMQIIQNGAIVIKAMGRV